MASSKLRKSCSFSNILLSCLNFILFILSAASIAPIILLKSPPTSMGWAFVFVSSISLLASFVGFYSNPCFVTHLYLLLTSSLVQLLAILALLAKEKWTLSLIKSPRDPKEAMVLARLECVVLMVMFVMQMGVVVMSCVVHSCWVREYEGVEAEKEASARKRSKRIENIQEESMANAERISEIKAKEFDEKMKSKYGQWV